VEWYYNFVSGHSETSLLNLSPGFFFQKPDFNEKNKGKKANQGKFEFEKTSLICTIEI